MTEMGVEKLTLVGGEPLLHPDIFKLSEMGKEYGFVMAIQTNGFLLNENALDSFGDNLDWIGVSIDSMDEDVELMLGRGSGSHVSRIISLCDSIRERGYKLKVNTTVTKMNYKEDLRLLIDRLSPDRWKIFQMLHVKYQNDDAVHLLISREEFDQFITKNGDFRLPNGNSPVFEYDDDMVSSYLMIGPDGSLISNTQKVIKHYDFVSSTNFYVDNVINYDKYYFRGGIYDW